MGKIAYTACAIVLYCATAFAAQTFTLPVGTTTVGPITVSKANRFGNISIDRTLWTDPNSVLSARIEYSIDGGKTWLGLCGFTTRGGSILNGVTQVTCKIRDSNTTHLRATAVVTGGPVVMTRLPGMSGK